MKLSNHLDIPSTACMVGEINCNDKLKIIIKRIAHLYTYVKLTMYYSTSQ